MKNLVLGNDDSQQCIPSSLCPAVTSTHTAPTLISSCGQFVTTSAVLTNDLNCASTGLFIGASGITIDLNGHVLKGDGVAGHNGIADFGGNDDVTIKNGVVRNFDYGVYAANGADSLTVSNIVASGNGAGMSVTGASAKIASSTAAGNSNTGIVVIGDSASITSSLSAGNVAHGFFLSGSGAFSVKSSSAAGNGISGFSIGSNSATVTSTIAAGNGTYGLTITADAVSIKSTTASGNAVDGIFLPGGDQATLNGNRADGNGFGLHGGASDGVGQGIRGQNFVSALGTNLARGNDDPAECSPSTLC